MTWKDPDIRAQKNRERLRKLRQKPGWNVEKNRLYKSRHPLKAKAHKTVENHLKAGTLQRGPCEQCGVEKAEAHHDDYSQPLKVRWLCRKHHLDWHRENGEGSS